jgi:predicted phage terminase large subunit-like protein
MPRKPKAKVEVAIPLLEQDTHTAAQLEVKRLRKMLVEKDRRELAQDFHEFFKAAWSESIEPHIPFHDSWHYELLCEYAQLLGSGEFKKRFPDKKGLMILIPPRTLKSITFSVALQAWVWTHSPYKRFLCLSYGAELATPLSQKARNLLTSKWYQKRWKIKIKDDANEKAKFENEQGGYRFSSGTVATGYGGNFVIIDDPLNARWAYSKARRQSVNRFWEDALTTRRNNPAEDVFLLVMQRLHSNDLAGHLLSKEAAEWEVVDIPMEAEEDKTYTFPISGKVHKRLKGDILVPSMNTPQYITGEKRNPKKWGAQFQQRPSPPGGFIFDPDKWNYYDPTVGAPDPEFQILSVDCAWKSGKDNDKVALMVMGVEGPRKYVLWYRHERMSYTGILDAIREARKLYPKISYVLVEAAANGEAVIKQLSEEMSGMIGVVPKDDKEARAQAASADLGSCYIPDPEKDTKVQFDMIDNFADFNGDGSVEFDDLIDAFTQAINWLRMRYWGADHLDKQYKEVTQGQNSDPKSGEECPGCKKSGTVVREGNSWICGSCGSSGRGGHIRLTKRGM